MSASTAFDWQFYAAFYNLPCAGDEMKVTEHYLSHGKAHNAVACQAQLDAILASLASFDADVYRSLNVQWNHFTEMMSKDASLAASNAFLHFRASLADCPAERVYHNLSLQQSNNRWDALMVAIDERFQFDEKFYSSFYVLPAGVQTRAALFQHWISDSIFDGCLPNDRWDEKKSMIFELNKVLQANNVDINFISSVYLEPLQNAAEQHNLHLKDSSEVVKILFLFLNMGRKLRIFFNAEEQGAYLAAVRAKLAECEAAVKDGSYVDRLDKVAGEFARDLDRARRAQVRFHDADLGRLTVASLKTNVRLIESMLSEKYIAMFKRFNKLPADASPIEVISAMMHNLMRNMNVDSPSALNDLHVKNFVLSMIFNGCIQSRTGKEEYLAFVKDQAKIVIKGLFDKLGVSAEEEAIIQDIAMLVTNKQIFKLNNMINMAKTAAKVAGAILF